MVAPLPFGEVASLGRGVSCVKKGDECMVDMGMVEKIVKNWSRRNFPRLKRPGFREENRTFVFCRTCSWGVLAEGCRGSAVQGGNAYR